MRLIDVDTLFENMEKVSWFNNADRDEIAEKLVLTAPTVGGWVNVKDRPPNEECLAFSKKYKEMIIGYLYEDNVSESNWSAENNEVVLYDVTHWMPLPEPPEEK